MIKKLELFCFLFFLIFLLACGKRTPKQLADLNQVVLTEVSGDSIRLANTSEALATVFVFLTPDCPIAQKYTLRLEELYQTFSEKGIPFYGVFNRYLGRKKTAIGFREKYKISFPLLRDEENLLKDMLAAEISPEVFVLNSTNEIRYQGMIDNWFFDLGKKRRIISENYLEDALQAIVDGHPIAIQKTQAVGCYLPD